MALLTDVLIVSVLSFAVVVSLLHGINLTLHVVVELLMVLKYGTVNFFLWVHGSRIG